MQAPPGLIPGKCQNLGSTLSKSSEQRRPRRCSHEDVGKGSDMKLMSQFQERKDLAKTVDLSDGQRPPNTVVGGGGALRRGREGEGVDSYLNHVTVYSSSVIRSDG